MRPTASALCVVDTGGLASDQSRCRRIKFWTRMKAACWFNLKGKGQEHEHVHDSHLTYAFQSTSPKDGNTSKRFKHER